jgi:S1-C subfamily serine protease
LASSAGLTLELPLNLLDIIGLLLVGLGMFFGYRSGFVIQALGLAGLVAGFAALIAFGPLIADSIDDVEQPQKTMIALLVIVGLVIAGQAIGSGAGHALRSRLGNGLAGGVDSGLGVVLGFCRGIFMVWLLGGLLTILPLADLSFEARGSVMLRALEARLPSPVVLATELSRVLAAAGLPDVFAGVPPPLEQRADAPGQAAAEELAAAAQESTFRVEALACGALLTGTSFAVEADHLVTNAHVVAGSDRLWISRQGSLDRWRGSVVLFDPRLDVALIYVVGLDANALQLADSAPDRGTQAAALGFTGGGPLRVIPAAVDQKLTALGRDLYGSSTVNRAVIELNADVAPGDSGGPLVIGGGVVGGVTFSESKTDASIGYALTPDAVAATIADARSRTRAADTGACIH